LKPDARLREKMLKELLIYVVEKNDRSIKVKIKKPLPISCKEERALPKS